MSNKIENIFKDKFDNYESTPSAGLFDNIMAKSAKKKRAIWLWSAAAIIFGCSLVALWLAAPSAPSAKQVIVTKPKTAEHIMDKKEQNENLEGNIQVPEITEPEATKTIEHRISKRRVSTQDHKKAIRSTESHEPILDTDNKKTPRVQNKELADLYTKLIADAKNNDLSKGRLITRSGEQLVEKDQIFTTKKNKEITSSNVKTDPASDLALKEGETDLSEQSNNSKDEKTIPKAKLNKYSGWVIEASAGPGLGDRVIDGDFEFIKLRNKTDHGKISYSATLQASYQIAPLWSIGTGINWTKRNETFSFSAPATMTINERTETRYETIIHPVLGVITRPYTVVVMDTTRNNAFTASSNNAYTSICIPIYIERVVYAKDKWSLMAKGGIQTSISNKASGKTLASDEKVLELGSNSMKQVGVNSLLLGFGATYNVGDRLQVVAYPQARWALNSNTNNIGFKQRDLGLYTYLGFRVRL